MNKCSAILKSPLFIKQVISSLSYFHKAFAEEKIMQNT